MHHPTLTPTIQDIQVTLLLLGGYQYGITLPSNSPLLLNLLNAVVHRTEQNQDEPPKLFQIPVNGQQQALWFSSDSLVGVITEPPIFIKTQSPSLPATPKAELFNINYWQIDNFLSPEEHQTLLDYAIKQEGNYELTGPATNTADYPEHRNSLVLYYSPEFADIILNRVRAVFWNALEHLNIPPFAITHIDAQLTAHNHGHYFRIHNDNGSERDATRTLTYVYYFYREPKAFTGGELLIYDTHWHGEYAYSKLENFKTIEPLNNRIIFFYSGLMHEVLPVYCPSKQFADSRFTINGWARK
ncbi:2OG-Fe(II) oxygenase [Planktothrix sp. FACHB-1365]|uniref:2OG-Fe(II) oxygenase n=1 Tax=Planktothrix sp. FACHB-1365 TaxID=2692855 RepID=UPI0016898AE4|nr:2OG-Fe(II) oxygenase [Planktothrix sp. FACHB-1365]MBD2480562.1 2OG-Fe(II) oxygenase [Planktothrix sp. FACHB-1365]